MRGKELGKMAEQKDSELSSSHIKTFDIQVDKAVT